MGGREGNEELRGRHHPKEFSRRISRGNSRTKMAWRGKNPPSSICSISIYYTYGQVSLDLDDCRGIILLLLSPDTQIFYWEFITGKIKANC